jgi:hypothetical protein
MSWCAVAYSNTDKACTSGWLVYVDISWVDAAEALEADGTLSG